MNGDYLWDKSGVPDPEIQRLEELLAGLRHQPRTPARSRGWVPAAIAASLLLALATSLLMWKRGGPSWEVASLAGAPQIGRKHIGGTGRLSAGQWLETDAYSRARLQVYDVGQVEVEPNSKLRLVNTLASQHRMALQRGKIQAFIWAPPRQFFVDTPSAVTVDLGCAYTLEVDNRGVGLVRVSTGWVAFESRGRESFIPAGAVCLTRPEKGPGTPYYDDASGVLQSALTRFDEQADLTALQTVLLEARPHDAITLWHLLRRVPAGERGRVYDQLAQMITVPPHVSRDGVVHGDANMINALWDSLGLGETSWWRMWKGDTPVTR